MTTQRQNNVIRERERAREREREERVRECVRGRERENLDSVSFPQHLGYTAQISGISPVEWRSR